MIRRQMVSGRRYCAEAKALFARMSTQPTIVRKRLINALILDLQAAGVWTGLDALYVLAAHDAQAARLNWKSTSYNLSLGDTPTFTTDRGYAGNGSSDYLATGYDPSTNGVGWTLNSASMSVWSRTSGTTGSNPAMGTGFGGYIQMNGGRLLGTINVATSPTVDGAIANGLGLMTLSRSASNLTTGYRNAVSVDTANDVSTTLSAVDIAILAAPNGAGTVTTFWDGEAAMASFGASRSGAQETGFYNALSTYMAAVGAV